MCSNVAKISSVKINGSKTSSPPFFRHLDPPHHIRFSGRQQKGTSQPRDLLQTGREPAISATSSPAKNYHLRWLEKKQKGMARKEPDLEPDERAPLWSI
ncbi:unnamed protein product [Cladocopium goreaui]|uniref:Uncharacterized protein n=1 Tax=Cladocopium goreaui TaxID=2562237 RepID=A0A9P1BN53_9DINO|nr:unnamed protein product [Cladocopium goreaui]